MYALARDQYLATQVLTAPPERLQLMLIEGAIRFAQPVADHWRAGRYELAFENLVKCRRIVTELLAAAKPEAGEVGRNVRAIYAFLFRLLTEAQHTRDEKKLADALDILTIERETWRQVNLR